MAKKTVLITGSTNGLGKAIANKFANEDIILLGRNEQLLKSFKDEIILKGNLDVDYVVCDFDNLENVQSAANQIKSKYFKIDLIIHNAGALLKANEESSHPSLVVNYLSPMLLNDLLLELLLNSSEPTIYYTTTMALPKEINEEIILNLQGSRKIRAYAVSKLAFNLYLFDFIQNKNIKLIVFDPRIIYTNAIKGMIPKGVKWVTPVARLFARKPEKIANMVFEAINENHSKIAFYKLNKKINDSKLSSYYQQASKITKVGQSIIYNK